MVCILAEFILQNLNDIPSLHGLEEDPTLTDEVTTRVLGFKAFR